MAWVRAIIGAEAVIRNIRGRQNYIGRGCERGIKLAALYLQRESQKLVPIEYGVLRASAFTRVTGKGFNTVANVGYTATYAIYVHENVEMRGRGLPRPSGKGNYWDPAGRGQAKFLEFPARRDAALLRKVIRDNAKIFRV